jgi:hypothetical protein
MKSSLENFKGLSSNGGFSSKKSPFSDGHFSPFQGSFGLRVPPLESLNLLLSAIYSIYPYDGRTVGPEIAVEEDHTQI